MSQTKHPADDRKRGKNPLEWIVFALSSVLVIAMIAVLTVEALRWQDRPPALSAKIGEMEFKDGTVIVPVEVVNHGDIAASEVNVAVTRTEGDAVQQSGVRFDFVPRQGTRRGTVSFPGAVSPGEVRITGVGFAEP
ncbi:hypothetical protein OKA04_14535 [Luteolibacter flavescens]|uniref:TIGR02588 family protein n=1 Tax=Luteolibacter flavescens TaxID=1859460 RepID=A0ABT3FQV0_9BACT|nr:hypothetical protein [Luteolibacter flavescens]MCW1885953.1 hypothetical protein [Luteolibacter flavescens]